LLATCITHPRTKERGLGDCQEGSHQERQALRSLLSQRRQGGLSVHTNTKKRAIKKAKARVSKLIYCGGFDWQFTINEQYTQPAPYKTSQARRCQKLIDFARLELGLSPTKYEGGSWINYLS
jgi:hypothetical protein